MKRRINIGTADRRERPDLANSIGRLLKRSSLSGHHKRWRILQKLACDPDPHKS